uniref:Helicase C-terminal domain-containing protein n=1 Tax=Amphimedon queenslandica TaxID=400682 RepID=A0A1X7UEQ6_AMPQE
MALTATTTTETYKTVCQRLSLKDPVVIAFGIGVDCSDVRVIYHWSPPSCPEEYMQESGRAGGMVSLQNQYCVMENLENL